MLIRNSGADGSSPVHGAACPREGAAVGSRSCPVLGGDPERGLSSPALRGHSSPGSAALAPTVGNRRAKPGRPQALFAGDQSAAFAGRLFIDLLAAFGPKLCKLG